MRSIFAPTDPTPARAFPDEADRDSLAEAAPVTLSFTLDPSMSETVHRSIPPVALPTAATTLAAAASISASVNVRSRGWNTTSMPTDF